MFHSIDKKEFEAGFISSAHSDEDIEFTIQAAKETFAEMK